MAGAAQPRAMQVVRFAAHDAHAGERHVRRHRGFRVVVTDTGEHRGTLLPACLVEQPLQAIFFNAHHRYSRKITSIASTTKTSSIGFFTWAPPINRSHKFTR